MTRILRRTTIALLSLSGSMTLLSPVSAANHVVANPSGQPNPSTFATQDGGCLGPLRGQIAQGQFAGVGPFGPHFTGTVDPGSHYGTVGEASFLGDVLGIQDVSSFCSQYSNP